MSDTLDSDGFVLDFCAARRSGRPATSRRPTSVTDQRRYMACGLGTAHTWGSVRRRQGRWAVVAVGGGRRCGLDAVRLLLLLDRPAGSVSGRAPRAGLLAVCCGLVLVC